MKCCLARKSPADANHYISAAAEFQPESDCDIKYVINRQEAGQPRRLILVDKSTCELVNDATSSCSLSIQGVACKLTEVETSSKTSLLVDIVNTFSNPTTPGVVEMRNPGKVRNCPDAVRGIFCDITYMQ